MQKSRSKSTKIEIHYVIVLAILLLSVYSIDFFAGYNNDIDFSDISFSTTGYVTGILNDEGFTTVSNWSTFRGTSARTGVTNDTGPAYNTTNWTFTNAGRFESSPAVSNGVLYICNSQGTFFALNTTNGTHIWNTTVGNSGVFSSPTVHGNAVYFLDLGSCCSTFYALYANNGSAIWTKGITGKSSPAVGTDAVYIVNDTGNDFLFALNISNGNILWNSSLGSAADSSPALGNGTVYVGAAKTSTKPATIFALNSETGTQIWNYSTFDDVWATPALANGYLYVGDHNNSNPSGTTKFYALNATVGTLAWQTNISGNGTVYSSAAVDSQRAVFGTKLGYIISLNATNGAHLWNVSLGSAANISSSPALAGGIVYIGTNSSTIVALNATTGASLWTYATASPIFSSPAVLNGTLFVGSNGGIVYAIGGPFDTAGPSMSLVSPTPVSGLNTTNTTHTFNATANDLLSNIDTVLFEWNGTNETAPKNGTGISVYSNVTKSSLSGTYWYRFWANDSYGNSNGTETRNITIDSTAPVITAFTLTPSTTIQGGQIISSCSATDNLDPNPSKSITGLNPSGGLGTHTATCTATDWLGNVATATTSYTLTGSGESAVSSSGGGSSSTPTDNEETSAEVTEPEVTSESDQPTEPEIPAEIEDSIGIGSPAGQIYVPAVGNEAQLPAGTSQGIIIAILLLLALIITYYLIRNRMNKRRRR